MKTALRILGIALLSAMVAVLAVTVLPPFVGAQGPVSYRDTGSGIIFSQPIGFEGTALSGQDVMIRRPQAGHLALTTGLNVAAPDVIGLKTLAGGTGTVTFATAYTIAPICVATDTTAAAAVRVAPTTTTVVFTGTTTDVISYLCFANPN